MSPPAAPNPSMEVSRKSNPMVSMLVASSYFSCFRPMKEANELASFLLGTSRCRSQRCLPIAMGRYCLRTSRLLAAQKSSPGFSSSQPGQDRTLSGLTSLPGTDMSFPRLPYPLGTTHESAESLMQESSLWKSKRIKVGALTTGNSKVRLLFAYGSFRLQMITQ